MPLNANPVDHSYSNTDFAREVLTSAEGMIRNYRHLALNQAEREIHRAEKLGDDEGAQRWQAIAQAILGIDRRQH